MCNDEPSNIKWQNFSYSACKRLLRKSLSLLFALVLIVISFIIVVYGKYAQEQYISEYSTTVSCKFVKDFELESEVLKEIQSDLPTKSQVKLYCFCKEKSSELGLFAMTDYKFETISYDGFPCRAWFESYIQFVSLTNGIIILIPFLNALIIISLTFLTNMERNKTLTEDLLSNMLKCFVTQFLNTAIVLLIVNINIASVNRKSPIFTGQFNDIDPLWYSVVGATILFTMIINIFTPHLSGFMWWGFYMILRCCDYLKAPRGKKTAKKNKKQYFALYVGPRFRIDSRYASVSLLI